MTHVYIAGGELFLRDPEGPPHPIESTFAREKAQQDETRRSLHAWKSRDPSPHGSHMLWGKQAMMDPSHMFRFRSVFKGDEGQIHYVMTNHVVTGLFRYDLETDTEYRLFHKNEFHEFGMDYSPARSEFLVALGTQEGQVNLELLDKDGKRLRPLTGGDSQDTCPSFSRQDKNCILYQSRGIGRMPDGMIASFSPDSVHRLNLETGEIEDIFGDDEYDYLLPREDHLGNIYCIRRPHGEQLQVPAWRQALNVLLFPFHLAVALLNFLRVFTTLFSQKPMHAHGAHPETPANEQYVSVLGHTINLAQLRRQRQKDDSVGLVPRSWELVRRAPGKQVDVLAAAVSYFDLDEEGQAHYCNGFQVRCDRVKQNLFKHEVIETFCKLPGSAS